LAIGPRYRRRHADAIKITMNVSGCVDVCRLLYTLGRGATLAETLRLFTLILAVASFFPLRAGWTEIPETRSPDGQYSLFYRKAAKTPDDPPYQIFFLGPGHSFASAELVPDLRGKIIGQPGDWKTMDDFDSQILLNALASRTEAFQTKAQVDPAFSRTVQWTPDSLWASLEGGSHKFWHMEAWHLAHGSFEQVNLSREATLIGDYFETRAGSHAIQDLGMERKVKAIRHRSYDRAYITWLRDGVVAVDGYPFLLNDSRFGALRETIGEVYFLLDCHDLSKPRVIGICH
jgi:hypothetical protein